MSLEDMMKTLLTMIRSEVQQSASVLKEFIRSLDDVTTAWHEGKTLGTYQANDRTPTHFSNGNRASCSSTSHPTNCCGG